MVFNLAYLMLLVIVSPLIAYRSIRYGRYRRGWAQKLFGRIPFKVPNQMVSSGADSSGSRWWIHAVSVGEVNLLPDLVKRLQQRVPNATIMISCSTDTGYDLAVKLFGQERVFFCPLDFTWAVKATLDRINPDHLILTELELWPNLIRIAAQRRISVHVVNGRLSPDSARSYQRFGFLTRPLFGRLDWVGCQDAPTADRFAACGVSADRLCVTGSVKFDNAPSSRDTPEVQRLADWSGIGDNHRVWIVGSTQAGEEAMAIEIYKRMRHEYLDLRLLLVPRHAERFDEVAGLIDSEQLTPHRRSAGVSMPSNQWDSRTVILVDTIGELRHWWGVGHIATVGGSFGDRGGQNMLEPAGYGLAVSFGPNTKNFASIADRLVDSSAAIRVRDQRELEQFVRQCCDDVPTADRLGVTAQNVVKQQRGAIDRTLDGLLAACLPAPKSNGPGPTDREAA